MISEENIVDLNDEEHKHIFDMSSKIMDIFDQKDSDTVLKVLGVTLMTIMCDNAPSKDAASKALGQLFAGVMMSIDVNDEMGFCNWNQTLQ